MFPCSFGKMSNNKHDEFWTQPWPIEWQLRLILEVWSKLNTFIKNLAALQQVFMKIFPNPFIKIKHAQQFFTDQILASTSKCIYIFISCSTISTLSICGMDSDRYKICIFFLMIFRFFCCLTFLLFSDFVSKTWCSMVIWSRISWSSKAYF